jgi:hypothetical protein
MFLCSLPNYNYNQFELINRLQRIKMPKREGTTRWWLEVEISFQWVSDAMVGVSGAAEGTERICVRGIIDFFE